jgi:hypothetical protein
VRPWPGILAALAFGGIVALLARLSLHLVFDASTYADRFNTGLFVLGTLVVAVVLVTAASTSLASATGAAIVSTATILISWMGVHFADTAPAAGGIGRILDELRAALEDGYLDPGAIILTGAFIAVAILRARAAIAARRQADR